jgi:hypothetical protein
MSLTVPWLGLKKKIKENSRKRNAKRGGENCHGLRIERVYESVPEKVQTQQQEHEGKEAD